MTLSQIGRAQLILAVLYSIPLLPLSLMLALMTQGLALLGLIPLWWAGVTLMRAQDNADEHSHPGVWWCSLAYHGVPLVGWTAWLWSGGLSISASGYVYMVYLTVIFLSPLLGTLLSLLALVKVGFRMTAQTA